MTLLNGTTGIVVEVLNEIPKVNGEVESRHGSPLRLKRLDTRKAHIYRTGRL